MSKNLVIVESPTKAKTITRFLGKDFKVMASMGHVRDLPKSKIGIDTEKDFEPKYIIPVDKKKVVKDLSAAVKKAEKIWIATDEDREGEAIGWHLLHVLKTPRITDHHRIVFHEITEKAIKEAVNHPRKIDQNLVNAQQARRILDRLVGYELSPLLWKKVRYGLSAGRVQSVAVRLIVEREREIRAFKPEEYWSVIGSFKKDKSAFDAELQKFEGKKLEIHNEKEAKHILKELDKADYKVTSVEEKTVSKAPAAPFTTSTLQQEASRKLGFSVQKTMMIAQQLYEGINLGDGESGLITYMRTDSFTLASSALETAKEVIEEHFGKEYALKEPRKFKNAKNAQEAHEAIRPTNISLLPDHLKKAVTKDQHRLYELIWKRTVACQMAEAKLNRVGIDIESFKGTKNTGYTFRATGQTVVFPGFMKAYMEGHDTVEEDSQDEEKILPKLEEKDSVDLEKLTDAQHFTQPPARYTEASLVKKLESEGIGRPSTYAPTIHTIITRGYVQKEAKALKPTDVAEVVTDLLVDNFKDIVDYKFTADMETKLDEIEEGKWEWVPMLRDFYVPFHKNILEKDKTLKKSDIVNEKSDEICDKCGSKMVIKLGRFGKFLSCSNYPKCKNAKPLKTGTNNVRPEPDTREKEILEDLKKKFKDKKCDKCGGKMVIKEGRYGAFLGCGNYPKCKNITPITIFSGVKCPKCKGGQLIERRTRKGNRPFWGCSKFPKCKFATWDEPVDHCKKCHGLRVENKDGKVYCPVCDKKEKEGNK